MNARAPVNADPSKVAVMNTIEMPWEPTEWPGVSRKVLELVHDPKKGRETALLKFAPGATIPAHVLEHRLDVLVVEGTYSDGTGEYGASSRDGCVIYAKWRVPIRPNAGDRIVIDAKTAQWLDFPHRGAKVLHLYPNADGIETSRIGNVAPNRKLPSHNHSIGEETLVLEGCLKDEYAAYSKGIWFRMPCGVPHAPYTEAENCLMLIREGDLVW
jgi:anti-sigma factor ChrR (cupin superfamily)